jgi:hypothetical protein
MKFTYVPVQDPDGSWRMVVKLSPAQRMEAEKSRRRLLNIKSDWDDIVNPWWAIRPELFASSNFFVNTFYSIPEYRWLAPMRIPMAETEKEKYCKITSTPD